MAAPQRRYLAALPTEPGAAGTQARSGPAAARRGRAAASIRRAGGGSGAADAGARLLAHGRHQPRREVASSKETWTRPGRRQRLEVRVAGLSGRADPTARGEKLSMRAQAAKICSLRREGEDGTQKQGEEEGGQPRA
jgi:hypothetical protein